MLFGMQDVTKRTVHVVLLVRSLILRYHCFLFTGGTFNRTAVISYQKGGTVMISQRFFGHDALNNIRMDTYINGTVPEIINGEKLTVDEYKEEYQRVAPGMIILKIIHIC